MCTSPHLGGEAEYTTGEENVIGMMKDEPGTSLTTQPLIIQFKFGSMGQGPSGDRWSMEQNLATVIPVNAIRILWWHFMP